MNGETTERVQGICPDGWHLPSDSEWHILENYLSSTTCDPNRTGKGCDPAGSRLKIDGDTGFNAEAGGNIQSNQVELGFGRYSFYWTSTKDQNNAIGRYLDSSSSIARGYYSISFTNDSFVPCWYSVRCIKD